MVQHVVLPAELAAVESRIADALGSPQRVGVAFSGGVDSSVLLAVCQRALGQSRTVAILGVSPSLPESERRSAHDVAAVIGSPLVELRTNEADDPLYMANGPDRCFHCKDELFTRIGNDVVAQYGLTAVAYGENADDARRPDRPGARAATQHRVLRPLADAGADKSTVRSLARALGLPSADKPAAPCLASRIPHFTTVTPTKLAAVEAAEASIRALGFADCRVRHHGDVARVELPLEDLSRACSDEVRPRLQAAVMAAGFRFVSLDLGGIQSGAFTLPLVATHD